MLTRRLLSIFGMLFLAQCGTSHQGRQQVDSKEFKEPLIKENIKITAEEQRQIERYIERAQWTMEQTGTGLHIMIYEKGFGVLAKAGMTATVEYDISLLDGTLCYSSVEKGPRKFVIGRDNVESGIHEGILQMHVGDKAKFVIPSYLAHGLVGDQNKIPPRSSLVVDLRLIMLE